MDMKRGGVDVWLMVLVVFLNSWELISFAVICFEEVGLGEVGIIWEF